MNLPAFILMIVAAVLLAVATVGVASPPRFNLLAAGLFFIALSFIATTAHAQPGSRRDRELSEHARAYLEYQREVEQARRKYCRFMREEVRQHPRLILPQLCWRGYDQPRGPR